MLVIVGTSRWLESLSALPCLSKESLEPVSQNSFRGYPGALLHAVFCSGLIPDEAEIDAISSPIVFDHFGNTGKKNFPYT